MLNLNAGEILKEMGVSGLMFTIMEAIKKMAKDGVEKIGDGLAKKITKEIEEEKRAEMLGFLRSLAADDLYASKKLLDRQTARQEGKPRTYKDAKGDYKPYLPGDENTFVKLLTKLYIALDEPEERNTRIQVFIWLGNISDEEFDARLEFLNHDVVLQYLKRILAEARSLIDKFCKTKEFLEIKKKAAEKIGKMQAGVNNPSWFGKLANSLIK